MSEPRVSKFDFGRAPNDAGRSQCAGGSFAIIAANPFSGSGPTRRRVADLAASLARRGIEPRIIWDRAERTAALEQPNLAERCCCVVAAGGDGTVADVINEISDSVPFATLPSGNENLFARQFGFTRNGRVLARAIAAGRTHQIDLARAGERLFSLMLSAGFDAAVVHQVVQWRISGKSMRRVNRFSYAKPIVDTLRNYGYGRLELEADGVRMAGTHAFAFNLPQYGFQMPFAPMASGDDGLLDWLVFERPGFGSMASYLMSLVRGKHFERADVHHGRARRIKITATVPVPVQMDGEAAGFTPVELEIVPQALRVIAS